MEPKFNQFKEEILKRAKHADACKPEYSRAYKSETFAELIQVIKDNFNFAVSGKVIEPTIIEAYKDEFNSNDVWCNVDCYSGFLLCDNATVKAYDNATVKAYDNATVKAYGNATVEAYGNAYISSYYVIECKLSDNAIYRIRETNTICYASDTIKFEKSV